MRETPPVGNIKAISLREKTPVGNVIERDNTSWQHH